MQINRTRSNVRHKVYSVTTEYSRTEKSLYLTVSSLLRIKILHSQQKGKCIPRVYLRQFPHIKARNLGENGPAVLLQEVTGSLTWNSMGKQQSQAKQQLPASVSFHFEERSFFKHSFQLQNHEYENTCLGEHEIFPNSWKMHQML